MLIPEGTHTQNSHKPKMVMDDDDAENNQIYV